MDETLKTLARLIDTTTSARELDEARLRLRQLLRLVKIRWELRDDLLGETCVVVTDHGPTKIRAIKALRLHTGWGLKTAKAGVEGAVMDLSGFTCEVRGALFSEWDELRVVYRRALPPAPTS